MTDLDRNFHETWLGMVQPTEGLVVSIPVLVDAQCMRRHPPELQARLLDLCPPVDNEAGPRHIVDLDRFLDEILGLEPALFDREKPLPEDLCLYVPEGRQTLRPTLGLRWPARDDVKAASDDEASTPASRAGRAYMLLVWDLPDGLDLDRSEAVTGPWEYPPDAKFERLLRACRVPIGVLCNRRTLRLVYAPHGESSGSITFRLDDMAQVGGRPILDALVMLLGAHRLLTADEQGRLPAILAESRRRQANVTNALAEQVLQALEILLAGFARAAERDGWAQLDHALREREPDHLYGGLLTTMLRLVFVLYAEDRGLLPVEHRLYSQHYSLLGLFEQLQQDAGAFPETMGQRFGAWGRLVALFRAVFLGVKHDDLFLPPRRGELFDPNRYPFLEGWGPAGSAPIKLAENRAAVRLPSVDDATVFGVLEKLVLFEGQRLSYRALDVEQLGSVYEGLMGFHVRRLLTPAVCMRPNRIWLSVDEVQEVPKNQRARWLKDELGLSSAQASKLAGELANAPSDDEIVQALATQQVRGTAVARPGSLVLQPGSERRRTSSHYTPRSLSAPIVEKTLAPLIACMGPEPASEHLLQLKICDPAMGSGAFLVEACRYLADQVVAAWTREARLELVADAHEDVVNHARRLVAQRCLYGVDKNGFAVTLAKLSLWLVTMAKNLPFTFVDHALRHGDSLVGLDFEQIRSFHWHKDKQLDLMTRALREALDEAIGLRQQILDLAHDTGLDATGKKQRLFDDASDALDHVRLLGDLVVGAFFSSTKDKERETERNRRLDLVNAWLRQGGAPPEELRELQQQIRERLPVFHWMVEYPEVFYAERPDPLDENHVNRVAYIDAFVGNPPFLGGSGISGRFGEELRDWLLMIHEGSHGNADYSAHFFRRADGLLGAHGTMGLIATNTIAQGDTRTTGLKFLVDRGLVIHDATRSMLWPGEAAVAVAVVHLAKGRPVGLVGSKDSVPLILDGKKANAISSRLRPSPDRPDPTSLNANAGLSYLGSKVYGQGFTLTPDERETLVKKDERNAERIFPYIGGEEVNSSPTQDFDRYVINFGQMELHEAERWPDLIEIVREKVKPERDKLNNNPDGRRRKQYWWQFGRYTPALFDALRGLVRCLVIARTSKSLSFSLEPTSRVFSENLVIFSTDSLAFFSVLQCSIHKCWVHLTSSTLKGDQGYRPTDCLETFPFPRRDPRERIPALEDIGSKLYDTRARFMVDTQQGLTTTYNLLKDPSCDEPRIIELRKLHEAMDRAVLDAYGWHDVAVPPYCPTTDADRKAIEKFEDEVIDRLFVLNAERAAEEAGLGMGKGKGKGKKGKGGGDDGQRGLFE